METFQDLQNWKYTRVEFVNISNVFICDWFSYEFKIEMKLPGIYNNVFLEFIYACYIYEVCPKSKCTDFLFKCLLDSPEITSYLLQSMTLGKLHSGSVFSADHSSAGSHFL